MMANSNHAYFQKVLGRGLQEVLNEISFSRFLEQVDSKVWRVHLLFFNGDVLWKLPITCRNRESGLPAIK
jgi:hypothetical protein